MAAGCWFGAAWCLSRAMRARDRGLAWFALGLVALGWMGWLSNTTAPFTLNTDIVWTRVIQAVLALGLGCVALARAREVRHAIEGACVSPWHRGPVRHHPIEGVIVLIEAKAGPKREELMPILSAQAEYAAVRAGGLMLGWRGDRVKVFFPKHDLREPNAAASLFLAELPRLRGLLAARLATDVRLRVGVATGSIEACWERVDGRPTPRWRDAGPAPGPLASGRALLEAAALWSRHEAPIVVVAGAGEAPAFSPVSWIARDVLVAGSAGTIFSVSAFSLDSGPVTGKRLTVAR
jgi:hypothetical protein